MRPLFRCPSCDKFEPNAHGNGGGCHAGPPTPLVVVVVDARGQPSQQVTSAWPGVSKDDWCWQHPMAKNVQTMAEKLRGGLAALGPDAAPSMLIGAGRNHDGVAKDLIDDGAGPDEPPLPGENPGGLK